MKTKKKRDQLRERQRKQKLRTALIWGGIGTIALALLGIILWRSVRPLAGEAVPIMVSSPHLSPNSDPGNYNSDPPTSGLHYAETSRAGFYDENIYDFPAAYLVHNLEHGYVVFWYNCDTLSESECAELKSQIRTTIDDLGSIKLIAYPWPSIDVPVVMTSWGRLQRFEIFEAEKAKDFYRANLNRAPEPGAP